MMEVDDDPRAWPARPPFVRSCSDRVLLSSRVLDNLLVAECDCKTLGGDYISQVQGANILAQHRKIVTDWMLEVCQDHCSPQVFLSAVRYLDTVLAQMSVTTSQLQLLAAACLSLASKLSDPRPLSLYKLVIFTDCSISLAELQNMEMLVLQKLRWELSVPTSLDFLSHILSHLETFTSPQILRLVGKQSQTFLMLAATEYSFYNVRCSVMVRDWQRLIITIQLNINIISRPALLY